MSSRTTGKAHVKTTATTKPVKAKRQSIIDACRQMNSLGINQGTSGNISLRMAMEC